MVHVLIILNSLRPSVCFLSSLGNLLSDTYLHFNIISFHTDSNVLTPSSCKVSHLWCPGRSFFFSPVVRVNLLVERKGIWYQSWETSLRFFINVSEQKLWEALNCPGILFSEHFWRLWDQSWVKPLWWVHWQFRHSTKLLLGLWNPAETDIRFSNCHKITWKELSSPERPWKPKLQQMIVKELTWKFRSSLLWKYR